MSEKTTTTDHIRAMTDEEYLKWKRKLSGTTIRALVNKKEDKLDRELIVKQYKLGATQKFLAESFGITRQGIAKILKKEGAI